LGYGEIQFEKPQVWLFDDHLGNAGEMGKYGFNGREAPAAMGCPACVLGFLFRFFVGVSKKKWYSYPELCLLLLGIQKKG